MAEFFEALVLLILYLYVGGIIIAIPVIIIFYIYAEKPGKTLLDWNIADWIRDNSKFVSRTTLVCGFFLSILISTVGDYPHPIRTMIDVVFND